MTLPMTHAEQMEAFAEREHRAGMLACLLSARRREGRELVDGVLLEMIDAFTQADDAVRPPVADTTELPL